MKTRMTTKVICFVGIMFLLVLLTLQTQVKAGITTENNTNRSGQDYKNFWLNAPDPGLCRDACANDPNCQAYTYVKPGIQGPKARCWLKKGVPAAQSNNCCVSGVKTAQADKPKTPQGGGSWGISPSVSLETDTNRPGKDYKNFELDTPDPGLCQKACANDPNCQAYTYVKPGIQGAKARCWLKKTVPPAQSNNCCVSGVKEAPAAPPAPPPKADGSLNSYCKSYADTALKQRHLRKELGKSVPVGDSVWSDDWQMHYNWCLKVPKTQSLAGTKMRDDWLSNHSPSSKPPLPQGGGNWGISPSVSLEANTNRPGQDYRNFELDTPDPGLCQKACANDPTCQAYTYVKPGIQGAKARCWLKKTVPPAQSNNCCVSGVKEVSSAPASTPKADGSLNSYCKSYADTALKQRRLRKELGESIPAGDPVWSDDWQMHYDWCLKVPKTQSLAGTKMRDDWLSSHSPSAKPKDESHEDTDAEFVVYISDEEGRFVDYANGFIDEFKDTWKKSQYYWGECRALGHDHLNFVDSADLAFLVGHGIPSVMYLNPSEPDSCTYAPNCCDFENKAWGSGNYPTPRCCDFENKAWGSYSSADRTGDLEYIVFMSCNVLKMDSPKNWRGRWRHGYEAFTHGLARPFSGLHMALGYRTKHVGSSILGRWEADEFAENLKDGLPVRHAWYEAVDDYRHWVPNDRNQPAIFYIRPHKNETLDEHDSRDYKYGHPDYLLDAMYSTNISVGEDFEGGWYEPAPDPPSYW